MVKKEESAWKRKKTQEELNVMLLENFAGLQRAITNMSLKFDKLSDSISKLLNLFEMSARSFMTSPAISDAEKDKEFLEKLNMLLDQNKTIAKGLTLMEEKFRERLYGQRQEFSERQASPMMMSSSISNQPIKKLPKF